MPESKLPAPMQKEIREFCSWSLELGIADAGEVIELMQAVRAAHISEETPQEGEIHGHAAH
jgi:hypothetical protein